MGTDRYYKNYYESVVLGYPEPTQMIQLMPGKYDHVQGIIPDLVDKLANMYRGSPTNTVSTSTIFSAIGIKLILVEFLALPMY